MAFFIIAPLFQAWKNIDPKDIDPSPTSHNNPNAIIHQLEQRSKCPIEKSASILRGSTLTASYSKTKATYKRGSTLTASYPVLA